MPKVMPSPNLTTIGQISHPISPSRSPEKTQMPCQNSDTFIITDTVLLWDTNMDVMSCCSDRRILITLLLQLITEKCCIFHLALLTNPGLSRILNKHFLVQRFSNYSSLAVRPITGQNQFSELQSTFFFLTMKQKMSESTTHIEGKFLFPVYTLYACRSHKESECKIH